MTRAFGGGAGPAAFPTFQDQRNRPAEPGTAAYAAPAPAPAAPRPAWTGGAPALWDTGGGTATDDRATVPHQRSDIVLDDRQGWADALPGTEDRPPAESISGNRLFTVLLFFAGLAASLALWLFNTRPGGLGDTAQLFTAAGRVTGLAAGYVLFVQLLMMSRASWLEDWVGARDLLRWHRWLGTSLVVLVLVHIAAIVYGYALTAGTGLVAQTKTVVFTLPGMINAVVATGVLVLISAISIRSVRAMLPYELWHLLHLGAYGVLILGYGHQVATGADLSGRFAKVYWPALGGLVAAALVWGRVVEPLWLNLRHRFEVAEVVREGGDTFSIYIGGRNLDRMDAQAGQFLRWRFLTRGGWWQSHPFSLSAAPNERWLRLTVTVAGGHTAELAELQPGTRVWAEGPFGTFTAARRTRRRALLIAGGSGIAPIRALLEDMPPDTIVIYRAGRRDELVFQDELEDLAERRDAWVRYIVGSRSDPGPRRLFTPDGLAGLVPDVNRRDVYLCGPPGLVQAAVQTLHELGVPDSQLHLDPFEF